MPYRPRYSTLTFTKEELDKCVKFAYDSGYNYDYYSKQRNQNNQDKKKEQNLIGKLGEVIVYRSLKSTFPDITEPDFDIYPPNKKSWKRDIFIKSTNTPVHVKSQGEESAKNYGVSWVFQWQNQNGKGGKDKEIFTKNGSGLVCLVVIDLKQKRGQLFYCIKQNILVDNNLFDEPKLEKHRGYKKIVYSKRLAKFLENIEGKSEQ